MLVSGQLHGQRWMMLQFQSVSKRFPGTQALTDISFDVERGEIHALVGENGAGKSTLMKILSGVHTEYEGNLVLDGQKLAFPSPRDAQNMGISIIHQELNLIPELTVAENIFLGREPRNSFGLIAQRQMTRNARVLLEPLGLRIHPNRKVSSLRVGEQQLTEIAKALSLQTQILILDEPTSALSQTEIDHLFSVIADLKRSGVTMIYISHKFDEIFRLADRITVLRDGHYIMTTPTDETSEPKVIRAMVGRELSDLFPKVQIPTGSEVFRMDHLDFTPAQDSEKRSLHDISFSLHQGEILGVAGLMGAGRTELLEAIFGAHPAHELSGTMSMQGKSVDFHSPHDALEHGIALVSEDRKTQSLILGMPLSQNLTMSALRRFCQLGFIVGKRERSAVREAISSLRIKTPGPEKLIDTLSGGNQQKAVIGKCLLTNPRILLLDEPTRGIDVGAKAEIYSLMSDITQQGTSIIMASSELPELLAMCDRIMVLHDGRLVTILNQDEADQITIMEAATGHSQASAA